MKYQATVHMPTEANTEFFKGPVIFIESEAGSQCVPFTNSHGTGSLFAAELLEAVKLDMKGYDSRMDEVTLEQIRKELEEEGMFEVFTFEFEQEVK